MVEVDKFLKLLSFPLFDELMRSAFAWEIAWGRVKYLLRFQKLLKLPESLRSEYFWRSTNRERVIVLSSQAKLRKNALFIDQSAFSNFALYVINWLMIET